MKQDSMTRISPEAKRMLQVISNMRNQTQVSLLDAMVLESLEQLKQENPELVPLIQEQLGQG